MWQWGHYQTYSFKRLVAAETLDLHQMDGKPAFLIKDHDEDIYMERSKQFEIRQFPHHTSKPDEAWYGLKQAPWQLFRKKTTFLKDELSLKSTE